jgi:predicted trehalose synthase
MRYELDNRPQWTTIPMRGLIALLDRPQTPHPLHNPQAGPQ